MSMAMGTGLQTFAHFMIALAGVGLASYPSISGQKVMKDDLAECLADAAKNKASSKKSSGGSKKTKKEKYTEFFTKEEQCNQKYPVANGFMGIMKLYGGFIIVTAGFLFLWLVQRGTFSSLFSGMGGGQYQQDPYQQQYPYQQ